jgi:hypothetical protein
MGPNMSNALRIISRIISAITVIGTALWIYLLISVATKEGIPILWRFILGIVFFILIATVSAFNFAKPKVYLTGMLFALNILFILGTVG